MENQVIKCIMDRRSHRGYEPEQISEEQLQALIAAALQAPSALNKQPWHFSFIQNRELLARINAAAHKVVATLPEAERSPRFRDPGFHLFYNAPTAVIISSPEEGYSPLDCGIAVATLALAAEGLKLGSVIVALSNFAFAGEEAEALKKELGIPHGYRYAISIAIGRPNDRKDAHPTGEGKVSLIR